MLAAPMIPTESERVDTWRLHVLIEAGYPVPLAEKVAAAGHVDLHRAVDLIAAGCAPGLATQILL
jgi:hypothetical protein